MRLLSVFTFILFVFSCRVKKSVTQQDNIIGINYIVKLPLVQGDRQLVYLGDTTPIYYYRDFIIYQLPYTYDSSKTTYHIKADSISSENILTETRYNYFVYRQGSRNGIWYRSIEQLDSNKQLSVDSILSKKVTPSNLESIIKSSNYSLLEKISLKNGNVFIEKYIPKTKLDGSYNDTILLYYSRVMKPIRFSLSPYLDSMTNSKLYELRLAYNEAYSQQYSVTMPEREIVYKIEQITSVNSDRIKTLLERFMRDEKGLL